MLIIVMLNFVIVHAVMLSLVILNIVMLSVTLLIIVMLSVVNTVRHNQTYYAELC
jgi:hypothetical protein